jgi:2-oxoglutarate ferredoxin oxidoreductase subunit delta
VPDKGQAVKTVKGKITISQELCKECGLCIHFCPKKVIVQSAKLNAAGYQSAEFKDDGECTGCAICAIVCPEVAIEVYRD